MIGSTWSVMKDSILVRYDWQLWAYLAIVVAALALIVWVVWKTRKW